MMVIEMSGLEFDVIYYSTRLVVAEQHDKYYNKVLYYVRRELRKLLSKNRRKLEQLDADKQLELIEQFIDYVCNLAEKKFTADFYKEYIQQISEEFKEKYRRVYSDLASSS